MRTPLARSIRGKPGSTRRLECYSRGPLVHCSLADLKRFAWTWRDSRRCQPLMTSGAVLGRRCAHKSLKSVSVSGKRDFAGAETTASKTPSHSTHRQQTKRRPRNPAWWGREDHAVIAKRWARQGRCHSANFDHRITKKTLATISVGETVGWLSRGSAKYWSEWQHLNLRPLIPNKVVKVPWRFVSQGRA
jgi:hypothetical protein